MNFTFNLRHLQVFEAIGSLGGFSKAAEHLRMTQPAVSMTIKQLESDLNVALFDGPGRRRLSPAGQELLLHARAILSQVRAAESAMAFHEPSDPSQQGGPRGLLHLGVVSPAHYFAPQLLGEFHQRYPDVRLKLTVANRAELLTMLTEHQLDVAIMGHPPSDADLDASTFARHPHCVVAPAQHPLAQESFIAWEDLAHETFILREQGSATRAFFEVLAQGKSLQIANKMEFSGNEAVKHAVLCGLGISFLSAHVFQLELQAGLLAVLNLLDMPKHIDWCFIHRRDTMLTGVNQAFKQFVLDEGMRISACQIASLTPSKDWPINIPV
ncbi:LysR family transcriptional regulator [Curvibacter sp. CHRR-16]|uniref:LysR family transcriptional regulator n=1 Tax=Curvibacter sp. CHRR-16 TaxID=2835872 RepID=UPI001BD91E24|nr:LysR family transcriptional regulator [Curvibacter sp. CHRR-16]MBT0570198.1 LysR family transcriptional regulator [Curvibacter sp. CHRR-16]